MSLIDWMIVIAAVALIPFGYRQGLVVGGLALAGFALGAVLGARLGPLILDGGSESPYAPLAALAGGMVLGGVVAIFAEDLGVAIRRRFLHGSVMRRIDGIGGTPVGPLLILAIAWVFGAAALNAPALEDLRDDVQDSAILSTLNETFPPSGPVLNVLNRIDDPIQVRGPSADVAAPPKSILGDPQVQEASNSVVRILGNACGLRLSGSGWVAGSDLVVTNAHVVAGVDSPQVETIDGRVLDAEPAVYRTRNDLAILRVPGLGLTALELAQDPRKGTPGAVVGFPGSGDFSAVPARLGTTGEVSSQNSYGRGPVRRTMTSFRGRVENGNSGGPLIGGSGRVLTTVFAASVSSERPQGLGVPNSIVRRALQSASGSTDTGPCN